MPKNVFSIAAGLCLVLLDMPLAVATGQGALGFQGSLVEAGCSTHGGSGAMMSLQDCPQSSHGQQVQVQSVLAAGTVSALGDPAVQVRLVADSGRAGRYFDQHYLLVDQHGAPVRTGTYLVTLTNP